MSSGEGFRVSRRQALKLGGGMAVGLLGGEVAHSVVFARASDISSSRVLSARLHMAVGRVVALDGQMVQVQPFDSGGRLSAPLVGFPAGFVPRHGDHVAVTDLVEGYAAAALPVCSWVTGRPVAAGGETVSIGGRRVLASSRMPAAESSAAVKVCILDTSLAEGQVLAVRA
jgi:hypothetical protein